GVVQWRGLDDLPFGFQLLVHFLTELGLLVGDRFGQRGLSTAEYGYNNEGESNTDLRLEEGYFRQLQTSRRTRQARELSATPSTTSKMPRRTPSIHSETVQRFAQRTAVR